MAGGVNYTLAQAIETGDSIERAVQSGLMRCMYDSYADGGVATTVVYMGDKLPKGARIRGLYIMCDYADASCTLDIGDGDDVDRYVDALDVSSAVNDWQPILTAGLDYVIGTADDDDQIQITINAATGSGTIKLMVFYAV